MTRAVKITLHSNGARKLDVRGVCLSLFPLSGIIDYPRTTTVSSPQRAQVIINEL